MLKSVHYICYFLFCVCLRVCVCMLEKLSKVHVALAP